MEQQFKCDGNSNDDVHDDDGDDVVDVDDDDDDDDDNDDDDDRCNDKGFHKTATTVLSRRFPTFLGGDVFVM